MAKYKVHVSEYIGIERNDKKHHVYEVEAFAMDIGKGEVGSDPVLTFREAGQAGAFGKLVAAFTSWDYVSREDAVTEIETIPSP